MEPLQIVGFLFKVGTHGPSGARARQAAAVGPRPGSGAARGRSHQARAQPTTLRRGPATHSSAKVKQSSILNPVQLIGR